MADYRRMYTKLFNAVTDAIALLQAAQVEAEERFLVQDEPDLAVLEQPDDEGGSTT